MEMDEENEDKNITKAKKFVDAYYSVKSGELKFDELSHADLFALTLTQETWAEIRDLINRQIEQRKEKGDKDYLERKQKEIENYFLEKFSEEFIQENFTYLPAKQKAVMKGKLQSYMLRTDYLTAQNIVSNFLDERWRNEYVFKDKTKFTIFDYFSFGWTVLVNIITIIVVFILFGKAGTPFEQIILAILAIIFVSINFMNAKSSQSYAHSFFFLWSQFKHIRRKLLNEQISFDDEEDESDELQSAEKSIKKATVTFWINSGFGSVVYFIALYKLISAL